MDLSTQQRQSMNQIINRIGKGFSLPAAKFQAVRRCGSIFLFLSAKFQISIFMLLISFSACNSKKNAASEVVSATTYTCPMHPQIVEKKPGSCPICGMDLVRQSVEGEKIEVTDDLSLLLEPSNFNVVSGIRTVHPVREKKEVVSTFPGVVSYDTRQTFSLPIRVGGRIEQLYVRYNFQPVEKGQKLLEIYSPELLTAQRELLFLLESDPDNERLIEAARKKLRLLGVSEAQINQLIRTRNVQYAFPVYSSHKGYIVEVAPAGTAAPKQTAPSGGGMAGVMGGTMGSSMNRGAVPMVDGSPGVGAPSELSIQEGMYVESGQALFRIIDASQLWAEFNVSAEEARLIEEGDQLEISWGPGEQQQLQARVDFIQPFFNRGEDFTKIRTYLKDKDLRVGQLVEGSVTSRIEPSLWVPALAVLDVGNRKLVFVKQEGVLRPKEVVTGYRAGEMVEIVEGVTTEDAVAHNAQFLIDSEGIVQFGN